jgi:hypothetical protein
VKTPCPTPSFIPRTRCFSSLFFWLASLIVLAPLYLHGSQAQAQVVAPQQRTFPATTRAGMLDMGVFPEARIDGRDVRFAPGARILNESNVLITPASLQQAVMVRYRFDPLGLVIEAWILNSAERDSALRAARTGAAGPRNE